MHRHVSIRFVRIHRFEFFLALLLFFSSIPYIFGKPQPMSIDALLPHVFRIGWGIALMVGSLGIIIGLAFRAPRVEFIGLMILAWPAIVYAALVVLYNSAQSQLSRANFTVSLAFIMALFCLDRAWELWKLSRE